MELGNNSDSMGPNSENALEDDSSAANGDNEQIVQQNTNPTTPSIAANPNNNNTGVQNNQKKKALFRILILVGIMIIATAISYFVSKAGAEKRVNQTIKVCEAHGLYSSECKEAQSKNDVKCSITGKCEAEFKFTIFF